MKKLLLSVMICALAAGVTGAAERDDERTDDATVSAGQVRSAGKAPMPPVSPSADPEAPSVHWSVIAGGGGPANTGGMTLRATLGQPIAGLANTGGMVLHVGYWQDFGYSCCTGRVGDVNGIGGDDPTIGDVSLLIDALYISVDLSMLDCLTEADVNQSGGIDPQPSDISIGDLSLLIDLLFVTVDLSLLYECP